MLRSAAFSAALHRARDTALEVVVRAPNLVEIDAFVLDNFALGHPRNHYLHLSLNLTG